MNFRGIGRVRSMGPSLGAALDLLHGCFTGDSSGPSGVNSSPCLSNQQENYMCVLTGGSRVLMDLKREKEREESGGGGGRRGREEEEATAAVLASQAVPSGQLVE